VSRRGKKLTHEGIAKFMKQVATEVGVNSNVRVSPHTCRHTFAHLQLRNGLDIYSLSRVMGHESIAITQRYLEGIKDDQVLKAVQKTGVLQNL
jgi:integrase/recombinase XerD